MALVTLSLGSNIEREHHIRACLDALADNFGALAISRVFESRPVGFEDGRNFYNLVVAFSSDWPVARLQAWCKDLERRNGRRNDSPKFSPRTLDIDILTVDSLCGEHDGVMLPRGEVLHHAFVLQPLAELLPNLRHPVVGRRYDELWADFSDSDQLLWPIEFLWRGHSLPVSGPLSRP
ncbi:2-amino-4-hydroxy-6-hydroxymethyldihydropteridine diphosphokinase [Halomonas cupida]|uniref:2-amino-4-hydroxy-6- hydroxymethyldihydropteridine diphosphokinase n=1 Tax=Halomonas cupida TaxID=44933 RepID=UPI0039B420BD